MSAVAWAEVLTDDKRALLRQLDREARLLEATVRAFAIRAFDALQPYLEASSLTTADDEDRFHAWAGVDPLFDVLHRIAAHAQAASLNYPDGEVDWFDADAFRAKEMERAGL